MELNKSFLIFLFPFSQEPIDLMETLDIIGNLFKDESGVTIKQNCHAARHCILGLIGSDHNILAYDLVQQMVGLYDCSYWLVKVSHDLSQLNIWSYICKQPVNYILQECCFFHIK